MRGLDAEVEIPDSVRAVLAARIDMLPTKEKAALQAAAVIGRTFWSGPVYELLGGLEPDLRLLEDRDFVRSRAGSSLEGEVEYAFKHALTREVAYASLTKARRARLHAGFARWVERLGGGRDEHAPILAHHYAEAVRPEDADLAWAGADAEAAALRGDAVRWLRRAATLAVGGYAVEDGIALLERALELETGKRERAELWRELGRAQALRYDGEAFWAAMERASQALQRAANQLQRPAQPNQNGQSYGQGVTEGGRPDPSLLGGDAKAYAGKRWGVIGSGASGVQITEALAWAGCEVTQFIRRAQWVHIRENPYSTWSERLKLRPPFAYRREQRRLWQLINETDRWRLEPGPQREGMEREFVSYLDCIKDPDLKRKHLRPQQVPFADLARALALALTVPLGGFEIVTVVGESSRQAWDLGAARRVLGYEPGCRLDDLGAAWAEPFDVP